MIRFQASSMHLRLPSSLEVGRHGACPPALGPRVNRVESGIYKVQI